MKEIYNFLSQLSQNNNREWFNANKDKYLALRKKFEAFAQSLIEKVEEFDADVAASGLSVKDCTYRIYRDTRFSRNKEPYKTHMGIFICRGGKKSPYAGYYLHIEPPVESDSPLSMGNSFIIAGTYHYEPKVLRSIRDEISVNGDSFLDAISEAGGFSLSETDMLRKVPAEFAFAPEKWHHLLRCKSFGLVKPVDMEYICSSGALERIAGDFKKCSGFVKKLNMAIEYAYSEM